jgi:hypothetical protein
MNDDYTYPYYGKHDRSGLVVKFISYGTGEVIVSGDGYHKGMKTSGWNHSAFQKIEGENEMQNLKKGDLIIGSQLKAGGAISFAKEPKVQPNFIIASGEAERLAKLDPAKKFVVVEVKGVCSVQSTIWE